MKVPEGFRIDLARRVQSRLAEKVVEEPLGEFDVVVGLDVAYRGDLGVSVAAAYSVREGRAVGYSCSVNRVVFPYVPTLLSFRELMPMVRALRRLAIGYDVVMVDGQGIAHPYGLGIAAHLGVVLGVPTIGVAKSRLFGDVVGDRLVDPRNGKVIGAVVRCRKPLYVSIGNRITLDDAVKVVKELCADSSMPLPILLAHNKANELKRRAVTTAFDKWGEASC
ncbi:MAG: endonuclease V [Thermoproteus sp.]